MDLELLGMVERGHLESRVEKQAPWLQSNQEKVDKGVGQPKRV